MKQALSAPYMSSLTPDNEVLESAGDILNSSITTAEKYDKLLKIAVKSHEIICSDERIIVCADTASLNKELLKQAFSANNTKWVLSLFRNQLYEQDLKNDLRYTMPMLAVLAVRSKYGDTLQDLKPRTLEQADDMVRDVQTIYWKHDIMYWDGKAFQFNPFYDIENSEPKTFANSANIILTNLLFSKKSLEMIDGVKVGAQSLLKLFKKKK